MHAAVASTITFQQADCPQSALEGLRHDLSLPNPEYVSRQRFGRSAAGLPQFIECLVEHRNGSVEMPRGAVVALRRRLAEVNETLEFDDRRCVHAAAGLRAMVQLRPYQADAVQRMRRSVQGLLVLPPGGGKTVTGIAAAAAIDQPTLIIVHTHELLDQWQETTQRILNLEVGVVSEGTCAPRAITVGMVQTLVRLPIDELDALGRRFGCVIVDEAHHTPASTFQSVLGRMPARYRFGLTATPAREDGLTPLVDLTLGVTLFEVAYADLVAAGYLDAPEVRLVYTRFNFDYDGPEDYHDCMMALVEDVERNTLVADLAAREAHDGHTVLVLSARVAHCRHLCSVDHR